MYTEMNKILISLLLLCTAFGPVRAQLIDPDDSPDLSWDVAELEGVNYTSLPKALETITADDATIRLLIGVTLDARTPLTVTYHTTLDLNACPLVCAVGTKLDVAAGKVLTLEKGTVSGSFALSGSGYLFAGADVKLAGTGVTVEGPTQSLYRILVELPGSESVSSVKYGKTSVARYVQKGNQLCCWLPQSVASLAITYAYKPVGSGSPKKYTTAPLTVMGHAEHMVTSIEESGEVVIGNVAKVGDVEYATFKGAFDAVASSGGTITLLDNVSLNETVSPQKAVTVELENWTLTASGGAKMTPRTGGSVWMRNGYLSGNLEVSGIVIADQTVRLTAAVTYDGRQSYRTRLQLPADMAGKSVSFSYAGITDGKMKVMMESAQPVAYVWLPAHAASAFTLNIDGTSLSKKGVIIQANHDNSVDIRQGDVEAVLYTAGEDPAVDSGISFPTLAAAFGAATDQDVIVLQQSVAVGTELAVGSGQHFTFDLQEFTLNMQGEAALKMTGNGSLLVRSGKERGIISGNFGITGDVCVDGSVSLSGLVTKEGKVVYRTCLYLPDDATEGTWTYDAQTGPLFFTGGKNASGQAIAYIWPEVSQGTPDLKVNITAASTGEKTLPNVLIQATHSNRFDMEAGTDVATVGGVYYPSFGSALAEANKGGGTIVLTTSQTLNGMQNVTANVVIDLGGHTLSLAANAAFDVTDGASLRVADASAGLDKGYLYGTLLLNGAVCIDPEVRLSGTVLRHGERVYRLTIDGLSAASTWQQAQYAASGRDVDGTWLNNSACLWLPGDRREEELLFTFADGTVYETTLRPSLPDHNARQKAYRQVVVSADAQWTDDANKDCHVIIQPGKRLTIATNGQLKTFHRVTMCNGSQLVCNEQVLATDGIVYRRSFSDANRWEAFSLPYEARRITAVVDGRLVELSPYLLSGTGGHFWLQTLAEDGTFRYVAEETLKANAGYIIAVPEGLTTKDNPTMAVSFVSADHQFLNRAPVPGVPPTESGFRQFATGSLANIALTRPFYQLNAEGTAYLRTMASAGKPVYLPPFGSYVLTDEETLKSHATLRMAGLPTAVEMPRPLAGGLQVSGGRGCVRVEAEEDTLLRVYTFSGQLRALQSIPAGETILRLPAGLYIVNGKKVCISE